MFINDDEHIELLVSQVWEAGSVNSMNDLGSLSGRLLQLTQLQLTPPNSRDELKTITEHSSK